MDGINIFHTYIKSIWNVYRITSNIWKDARQSKYMEFILNIGKCENVFEIEKTWGIQNNPYQLSLA